MAGDQNRIAERGEGRRKGDVNGFRRQILVNSSIRRNRILCMVVSEENRILNIFVKNTKNRIEYLEISA